MALSFEARYLEPVHLFHAALRRQVRDFLVGMHTLHRQPAGALRRKLCRGRRQVPGQVEKLVQVGKCPADNLSKRCRRFERLDPFTADVEVG